MVSIVICTTDDAKYLSPGVFGKAVGRQDALRTLLRVDVSREIADQALDNADRCGRAEIEIGPAGAVLRQSHSAIDLPST